MLSSTSSSSQRLPSLAWRPMWTYALILPLLFILILEGRMALRGYQPTLVDSEIHWLEERARVASLGNSALVLVGGSRIQLGMDVPLLRELTGMEPVQLAIDGNSYGPVLKGLAEDAEFTGTVIVDFYEGTAINPPPDALSTRYANRYRQQRAHFQSWNFDRIENMLERQLKSHLRSYADGARPLDSLLTRIAHQTNVQQYLVTHPDRSRSADYARVPMPDFYFGRVMRNLGTNAPPANSHFANPRALNSELVRRIDALPVAAPAAFAPQLAELQRWTQAIQRRGGKVILLVMPSSGLVHEMERHSYPRNIFWDRIARNFPAKMIHYEDYPALRDYRCPDGSHLDYRDKAGFTAAFVKQADLLRKQD